MNYTKKIVCLANSRKTSGRCIAGKEILNRNYGAWIRPVSNRQTREISEDEQRFEEGEYPQVLDIITIPLMSPLQKGHFDPKHRLSTTIYPNFNYLLPVYSMPNLAFGLFAVDSLIRHQPHDYHHENHLIAADYYWEKEGALSWGELCNVADTISNEIWINGHSSYSGLNDRIPEDLAKDIGNSLLLVQPDTLTISINVEGAEFGNGKRKVRAEFSLNDHQYKLAVTDPKIESLYLKKKDGRYDCDASKVYMCISIGELYNNYCYKLVASVIYKQ